MSDCPKHGTPREQRYRNGKKAGWICVECNAAASKKWREAHREHKAEYDRKWMEKNRDKFNKYQRNWRRKKKESLWVKSPTTKENRDD